MCPNKNYTQKGFIRLSSNDSLFGSSRALSLKPFMLTHPLIENEVFMEPIEDIGSANWSSTKVIPSKKMLNHSMKKFIWTKWT